jgi:hypothetical protein
VWVGVGRPSIYQFLLPLSFQTTSIHASLRKHGKTLCYELPVGSETAESWSPKITHLSEWGRHFSGVWFAVYSTTVCIYDRKGLQLGVGVVGQKKKKLKMTRNWKSESKIEDRRTEKGSRKRNKLRATFLSLPTNNSRERFRIKFEEWNKHQRWTDPGNTTGRGERRANLGKLLFLVNFKFRTSNKFPFSQSTRSRPPFNTI